MRMRRAVAGLAFTLLAAGIAHAKGDTLVQGINNAGDTAGYYSAFGQAHGFIEHGGVFTNVDHPLASGPGSQTIVFGLNDAGAAVGYYGGGGTTHGFVFDGVNYSTLDAPGATATYAIGINNAGMVSGYYTDGAHIHGFTELGGVYAVIDYPQAPDPFNATFLTGINDAGDLTGFSYGAAGQHSFIASGGIFTPVNTPLGHAQAWDINNLGALTGNDQNFPNLGFIYQGGAVTDLPPGLRAFGINDHGAVAGYQYGRFGIDGIVYQDGVTRLVNYPGTRPTPFPEPTTWALMIAGFGLVGGALRRRTGTALA